MLILFVRLRQDELDVTKEKAKRVLILEKNIERYKQRLQEANETKLELQAAESRQEGNNTRLQALEAEAKQLPQLKAELSQVKEDLATMEDDIMQLERQVEEYKQEANFATELLEEKKNELAQVTLERYVMQVAPVHKGQ